MENKTKKNGHQHYVESIAQQRKNGSRANGASAPTNGGRLASSRTSHAGNPSKNLREFLEAEDYLKLMATPHSNKEITEALAKI